MIHGPVMEALVWARVPGDVVFGIGALDFAAFVAQAFWRSRASGKKVRGHPGRL